MKQVLDSLAKIISMRVRRIIKKLKTKLDRYLEETVVSVKNDINSYGDSLAS